MATFTWNTGSGSFNTAGNWTPSGPPGTSDTALFNGGSGTITGTGAVGTLNMSGGGPWTYTATINANFYDVNDATTITGAGVWTLAGSAAGGNYIIVANGANSSGGLTVSGGGKINSTQAANTAASALYVGGGLTATGANGVLTVTGTGSSVSTGVNAAAVGETGTGLLDIEAGATGSFSSPNSATISALGVGRAGNGTVKVAGTGSALTANGFVYIGRQGAGTLIVDQGGTVTAGSAASGSIPSYGIAIGDGTPTLDANGNANSPLYFGGSGTAQVTRSSTLHSLGSLRVGFRGTNGSLLVDTSSIAYSDGEVIIGGSNGDRAGAIGTVTVQGGATLRSGATQSNGNAGIVLGNDAGTTGNVTVSGANSTLNANGFRLTVGGNGSGTLTIAGGGKAMSGAGYTDTEAAFAVAGGAGTTGLVTITGAGSQLIASGDAVIGGNEKGAGPFAGGAGTVNVTGGGLLQTGAMTIERGSTVAVDQSSTLTTPSITINGGTANLAKLTTATSISFGSGGTLDLRTVTGTNTITNFSFGDVIDFANTSAVTLSGTTVTGGGGSLTIGAAPANASYNLTSDGNGGMQVSLTPQTIGVYRFFESNGTHFYTSSQSEAAGLANPSSPSYRSDLTEEVNGFGALVQVPSDPNEVQIFRFFDATHGTEFLTSSKTEASGLMDPNSSTFRSDLTFEANSSFYEDGSQQLGDVGVYRFFDQNNGTHFYTGNQSEFAALTTPGAAGFRSDLTFEGVAFYAPAGTYST